MIELRPGDRCRHRAREAGALRSRLLESGARDSAVRVHDRASGARALPRRLGPSRRPRGHRRAGRRGRRCVSLPPLHCARITATATSTTRRPSSRSPSGTATAARASARCSWTRSRRRPARPASRSSASRSTPTTRQAALRALGYETLTVDEGGVRMLEGHRPVWRTCSCAVVSLLEAALRAPPFSALLVSHAGAELRPVAAVHAPASWRWSTFAL